MQDVTSYYEDLFRSVVSEFGELDDETLTSIVGFNAGGPVSVSQAVAGGIYVTCELSLYSEQQVSSEGLKFELLCRARLGAEAVRSLLTAIGSLSMEAELGAGHTIDVSQVMRGHGVQLVSLNLYSRSALSPGCGIYEVTIVEQGDA